MEEARKTLITPDQQAIIDAGGRVESFYDTFEEKRTEEEIQEYKRLIGYFAELIAEKNNDNESFEERSKRIRNRKLPWY